MTCQLDRWKSTFGNDYTDRNQVDWNARVPAFRDILGELPLQSVLEVGCNRGHNLRALYELFPQARVCGVEPNPNALRLAQAAAIGCEPIEGDAYDLPFPDARFDLVFTAGVLIHVPPERFYGALDEIHRTSRRYVLALEYYSASDETVNYRGHLDMLWKRDYGQHYLDRFSDLSLVRTGRCERAGVWDDVTWWLLEKSA